MGRVAPDNLLWSRKGICSYLWKVRKSMKWQMTVERGGTPLELQEGHWDHHPLCATLRVTMNKSVRRMWRNQSLKSGETTTTSFPSGSHHCNQTPHISLSSSRHSLLSNNLILILMCLYPQIKIKIAVVGSHSGSRASSRKFCFRTQQCRRTWDPELGSSATPSHLHDPMYEIARLAY